MHVSLYIAIKLFQQDLIIIKQITAFQIETAFYKLNKYSVHAENDAIRKIKNKHILKECKIFIGKIVNNEISRCLPCDMCNKLLRKFGAVKIMKYN